MEILEQIKDIDSSPGAGYYEVFILKDMVVKKYWNKKKFETDVKIHEKLDDFDLIPRMIANFEHDEDFYLIVEKVECFDKMVNIKGEIFGLYPRDYFEKLDEIESSPEYKQNEKEYIKRLNNHGYKLVDIHCGNFGLKKDKTFVCLDEGCFQEIQQKD